MHNLLSRQLRKLGLEAGTAPAADAWEQFLARIDKAYAQIDQDRYLLERSLAISSEEMRRLNDSLRQASETELARERNKLRESLEKIQKLSLVASKARYGVTIADANGVAEWVNDGFTSVTGYTAAEVLGRKLGELLDGPKTDPETVQFVRDRLNRGERAGVEILNHAKDGREIWISLEIEPVVDEAGQLTNFIATQTDITERKAYEAQLRRAKEEAESANLTKSQFLANMSHEIRTPLNAILGFAELLLRDDQVSAVDRADYLATINSSGKHLLALINDVLDLSKVEAGQMDVEKVSCSPHQVVAEVVSTMRVRARERGITLEYEWVGPIPESIETDPHRLKQLLINLVGNAIKFTEQGGVTVIASVEARGNDGELKLAVRDTGIGIPADKLDTIFDPFVQADNSVTRRFGGTGLGLAISRRIAAALGGTVSVTSTVGSGSVFTVTVATGDLQGKVAAQTPKQHASDVVGGLSATGAHLTGVRVLVVDDSDVNRKLVHLFLSRCGAEVAVAENGEVALQHAVEQAFDIILMDMQMPVLDGYAATTELRRRNYAGPIIALTANAMREDRHKCERAGCSGYLSKPICFDDLIEKVAEATTAKQWTNERDLADSFVSLA